MTLAVKNTAKKGKIPFAKMSKLDRYLCDAVLCMQNCGRIEAHVVAKEAAMNANPKDFDVASIKEAQDSYKKQLKNYGLKEKMYYYAASNIDDAYLEDSNKFRAKLTAGAGIAVAVASTVVGVAAALEGEMDAADTAARVASTAFAIGVGGTAFAVMARNTIHGAFIPKTEEGKAKADEYVKIKHSLVALKQLKRVVEAPAKAARREEYKQEVAKYMSMTNPGGVVSPLIAAKKGQAAR